MTSERGRGGDLSCISLGRPRTAPLRRRSAFPRLLISPPACRSLNPAASECIRYDRRWPWQCRSGWHRRLDCTVECRRRRVLLPRSHVTIPVQKTQRPVRCRPNFFGNLTCFFHYERVNTVKNSQTVNCTPFSSCKTTISTSFGVGRLYRPR